MPEIQVDLTAEGGGGYNVYMDGVLQDGYHLSEREASERITNLALANPGAEVWYEPRAYRVLAQVTSTEAEPAPEPEPEPEPEPSPSADLVEDFSSYGSTTEFLSDPRGIYRLEEDIRRERLALDTSVGFGASGQSMRYDYPAGTATDYTVSRMLDLVDGTQEVWVGIVVRFSPNFTVNGNGQGGASAMKLLHVEVRGPTGRFGLGFNNGDFTGTIPAEGPNDDFENMFIRGNVAPGTLFDGEWHALRYHVRLGSPAFHEYWVDHEYQGSTTGNTAATELWGVALARNINKLSGEDMSMWWGHVGIHYTDPGWS